MKNWKLLLTVVLCSGLALGYGLFGCGDDENGENGTDSDCTVNADCDDGLFCNGEETCVHGVCFEGDDPCPDPLGCDEENDQCTCVQDEDCDDGVDCTVDSCNEETDTCDNTPDDTECDDGVFCNGAETCDAEQDCVMGDDPCPDPLGCDEENDQCTCVQDADCDDGLFCTGEETCGNNACVEGTDPCPGQDCDEDTDQCIDTE